MTLDQVKTVIKEKGIEFFPVFFCGDEWGAPKSQAGPCYSR